jgi:hypothetical protein
MKIDKFLKLGAEELLSLTAIARPYLIWTAPARFRPQLQSPTIMVLIDGLPHVTCFIIDLFAWYSPQRWNQAWWLSDSRRLEVHELPDISDGELKRG